MVRTVSTYHVLKLFFKKKVLTAEKYVDGLFSDFFFSCRVYFPTFPPRPFSTFLSWYKEIPMVSMRPERKMKFEVVLRHRATFTFSLWVRKWDRIKKGRIKSHWTHRVKFYTRRGKSDRLCRYIWSRDCSNFNSFFSNF